MELLAALGALPHQRHQLDLEHRIFGNRSLDQHRKRKSQRLLLDTGHLADQQADLIDFLRVVLFCVIEGNIEYSLGQSHLMHLFSSCASRPPAAWQHIIKRELSGPIPLGEGWQRQLPQISSPAYKAASRPRALNTPTMSMSFVLAGA